MFFLTEINLSFGIFHTNLIDPFWILQSREEKQPVVVVVDIKQGALEQESKQHTFPLRCDILTASDM